MEKKNLSLLSAGNNPTQEDTELTALNAKLYSEFSLSELEERLETDPLLLSSFLDNDLVRSCQCKKECDGNCTCKGQGFCVGQCVELGVDPLL